MRIAYLDCFSGISGDMFLGALVDAGLSPDLLKQTVAALNVGAALEIHRVTRGGIAATKVDVYAHGEKDLPREIFWEQNRASAAHAHEHSHENSDDHPHTHEHDHGHSHGHDHSHNHSHDDHAHSHAVEDGNTASTATASHSHEHARGLKEIRQIINAADISATAKATAVRIFEALGAAEAEIHNSSIEQVHFHEVGAVDAMVDIVCAAVGAESLGIDEWVCSSLNVGGGTVKCAHGTLPVPAPATLKLLKDAPVHSTGPQVELVTPTGAAIVRTLVKRFGGLPSMKVEKAGYGAGTREFPNHPNLLRITIGQGQPASGAGAMEGIAEDRVVVLEANLDDLSPQVLAYAMERLLSEGALDVFSVPVQMKKNRPGALLTVLAKVEDEDRLTQMIFAETSTLGVRRREERRRVLGRRWETVKTSWGDVRIKIANLNGTVSNYAPEFEDCRALAEAHHVPLKKIMEEALRNFGSKP